MLAFEMNGQPLAQPHGWPLRLVVPGWAGDHWMKWLVRLSPQVEAQKGFYMDTAYKYPIHPGEPGVAFKPDEMKPVTELFVKSNFTEVPAAAKAGQPVHAARLRVFGRARHRESRSERRRRLDLEGGRPRSAPRSLRLAALVAALGAESGGLDDSHRAGDRQPRQHPAEGRRLEPERLSLQRLARGGRPGRPREPLPDGAGLPGGARLRRAPARARASGLASRGPGEEEEEGRADAGGAGQLRQEPAGARHEAGGVPGGADEGHRRWSVPGAATRPTSSSSST